MFTEKTELHLPGPTIIPNEVQRAIQQAMDHPMMDYRATTFQELLIATSRRAQEVFRTRHDILIVAGSGASILEAAMVNMVGPRDTVIVCVAGYFGEYLASIAGHIGATTVRVDAALGDVIDPAALEEALARHPETVAVFATHCETSTGVLNDVRALSAVVAKTDAVFVVDAVSSLVTTPLETDDWSIDMVATASQKALMLPPGIALLSVGPKAWERIERHACPSFYFDLSTYRHGPSHGATPFTPNVPLVNGLGAAIDLILAEGLEAGFRRHALLRDMTRAGVRGLGLRCLAADDVASASLTTVKYDHRDAEEVRDRLRSEQHVVFGGGLGPLKGTLLRLGHLGYTTPLDVLKILAALELTLARVGDDVTMGAGVAAAQQVWLAAQEHAEPVPS